jgi:hypothetical protein
MITQVENRLMKIALNTLLATSLITMPVLGSHFYSDLRLDFINLDNAGDDNFVDQLSLTVGYRF